MTERLSTKIPDTPEGRPVTLDEAVRALELLHSYFVQTQTALTYRSRTKLSPFTRRSGLVNMLEPLFGTPEDEVRRQLKQHVLPAIRVSRTPGAVGVEELEKLRSTLQVDLVESSVGSSTEDDYLRLS